MKNNSPEIILKAINVVLSGEKYVSDDIAQYFLSTALTESPGGALTVRQLDIFTLVGAGNSADGIDAQGEIRSQWHHVIDLGPTIMEAAKLPFPTSVNGTIQKPFEGVSMMYAFDDDGAEDRHTRQYFEMFGNRAIYDDGWVAATKHRTPWASAPDGPLDEDVWELYHVDEDFSQAVDLAEQNPRKLAELQALFLEEAIKYDVLPIEPHI